VVTTGTPVDEHLNPHFRAVESCVGGLCRHLRGGQTLVLRAALFPGTSQRVLEQLRRAGLGGTGVCCCPERLSQGHMVEELTQVPQIVSGSDERALEQAEALFLPLGVDLIRTSLLEAEVSKLFLNAWRYVVFGTANQFYHIATSKGLDFHRIRAAIVHRYARAAGFPHCGFTAGPHLFKDTMQLAAYCRHAFSLGHAAMQVNETMPDCVLEEARRAFAQRGQTLRGLRCGILGMAFKPGSDDARESLAFKLQRLLLWEGADVFCSDPRIHRKDFVDAEYLVAKSDAVFIGCPHREYAGLVFRAGQPVFDCWGSTSDPALVVTPGVQEAGPSAAPWRLRVAVVGGAGHVGLPLSLVLADRGHHVVVIDSDAAKLESIRAGHFPFLEAGGPQLLARCLAEFPERFRLSSEHSSLRESDVVIVTIGTPVDEHLNPCYSIVEACILEIQPYLQRGQTLVLRSTLFPGTSARILAALRRSDVHVGVSFCPERIAEGHALRELAELPQIVSGSDGPSLEHARALFAPLGVDCVELELQEAETAKLFLNAWRYVNFATANQFYQIATSKGLDFGRIRAAITHSYPRASGFPRPGFTAGPCLFKDTMQLAACCRHTFTLGHAAMLVNETMPDCVVEQAKKALGKLGRTLAGTRCGVLGMAFKPDSDDPRESLAFKLRRLLLWEGAEVACCDVYIRRPDFVAADALLARSEVLFVGCPHREYRGLAQRPGQFVFDCWGGWGATPHAGPPVTPGRRTAAIGSGDLSLD